MSPASLDVAEVTPSEPPAATGSPTVAPPVQPPPQDPARVAEPEAKKRWRRHRDDDAPVDSPPPVVEVGSIPARLRAAEDAARTIEGIIRDLPLLADLEALSQALIGEVVDAFSPEVACLYLPSADGFWVAAGHQLTPAERRLAVKREHPLIRELLTTGEPMLIAPLDLARHMVGGIAGARTEAFITGPVRAGEACVGVVIVGRGDFDDKDLDRLAELTAEAAPGLAVAEAIDRLRALRPR